MIEVGPVMSLVWHRGRLVDIAAGDRELHLDGSTSSRPVLWGYPFDAASSATAGDIVWTILSKRRGTKALLLRNGKPVRELNRSYSHADAFDYPACLATVEGRAVVVHCPEEHGRIEIDDAESGARLTARRSRSPDFFHSRLAVSDEHRWLMSAGWVWHPLETVLVFDLRRCLQEPRALDAEPHFQPQCPTPIDGVAFFGTDSIAIASQGDVDDDLTPEQLQPRELAVWSLVDQRWVSRVAWREPLGHIHAVGSLLLSLYDHPKLIEPSTGVVVRSWPDLPTGRYQGCLGVGSPPIVAVDPAARRFAVASGSRVLVVDL